MNPYHAILNKTFDRRIPFTVYWELTALCNLSCLHCYAVPHQARNELSLEEIERVAEELAGMGCLFLTLTGGEIFCRPDIDRILERLSGRGFALHLFTNGTLLRPDMLDKVCAANPAGVEISLYSMAPDVHDRIVGAPGAHARTLAAIRACRRRGLAVTVKMMLLRYNVDDFEAVRDFALGAGVRFTFDFLLVPADDGSDRMGQHGLSENAIAELARRQGRPNRAPASAPAPDDPVCGAGASVMCIAPAGEVYPCLAIRRSVGNVRRRALRDIWSDSALDMVRAARHSDLVDCGKCADAGYCTRCAGVALAETGSLLAASPSACLAARATRAGLSMLK